MRPLIDKWNAEHPDEKVTFKEQTDKADQQHDDLVQNFQAKNDNYDVVSVDVVWTAEFAAKGWLQPLKDKMSLDTSGLLQPTVDAATTRAPSMPRRTPPTAACCTTARTWSPPRRRRGTR